MPYTIPAPIKNPRDTPTRTRIIAIGVFCPFCLDVSLGVWPRQEENYLWPPAASVFDGLRCLFFGQKATQVSSLAVCKSLFRPPSFAAAGVVSI